VVITARSRRRSFVISLFRPAFIYFDGWILRVCYRDIVYLFLDLCFKCV